MKPSLVSVIILSYNNFQYITEAISSVLEQTYSNIELIISDDSSLDFNEHSLHTFFETNNKEHISNIIVSKNSENIGTVKNMNKAVKMANGKYIIPFAADDVINDETVVEKFVKKFESNLECRVMTSQVYMCNVYLNQIYGPFIPEETKNAFRFADNKEEMLINALSGKMLPSCGTVYRRDLFDDIGYFDERYHLVEDFPFQIKLAQNEEKILYFDIASFKHREGGISHDIGLKNNKINFLYRNDMANIFKNEMLPNMHLVDENMQKSILYLYKTHKTLADIFSGKEKLSIFNTIKLKKTELLGFISQKFIYAIDTLNAFSYRAFSLALLFSICVGTNLFDNISISKCSLNNILTWSSVILVLFASVLKIAKAIHHFIYSYNRSQVILRHQKISDFLIEE